MHNYTASELHIASKMSHHKFTGSTTSAPRFTRSQVHKCSQVHLQSAQCNKLHKFTTYYDITSQPSNYDKLHQITGSKTNCTAIKLP